MTPRQPRLLPLFKNSVFHRIFFNLFAHEPHIQLEFVELRKQCNLIMLSSRILRLDGRGNGPSLQQL